MGVASAEVASSGHLGPAFSYLAAHVTLTATPRRWGGALIMHSL